jgi:hypothetical protein
MPSVVAIMDGIDSGRIAVRAVCRAARATDGAPLASNGATLQPDAGRLYFSEPLDDTRPRQEGSSGARTFVSSHADDNSIAGSSGARACWYRATPI